MKKLSKKPNIRKLPEKKILILNGSPNGNAGSCAIWASFLLKVLKQVSLDHSNSVKTELIHLKDLKSESLIRKKLLQADGLIFLTGTYWDSWGSTLQKLLESMTDLEGHPQLLGKPVSIFVLMHSVGGKGVLSRLQGVLSTYGFLIPPMSGMVYSLVNELALQAKSTFSEDFWQKQDVHLILKNLLKATDIKVQWAEWPVDRHDPKRKWLRPS